MAGARGGNGDGTARRERIVRRERSCLRRRARRAEAVARARADFLATMSHELREPLNGVLGMGRLLRDTPLDAEQRGYLEAILDSGEALLTLVNDVLDLSRIDAGRLELAPVEVAPRPFVERVVALVAPRARQKGLTVELAVDRSVPERVLVDPGRLRQVLLNLLGNAVKFTERGRVGLAIRARTLGQRDVLLLLSVTDTGPGIGEAELARLFRPWAQASAATGRLYGGSGLGLVLARRIVEAMGGTLACTSRPGVGTTFSIALPVGLPVGRAGTQSEIAPALAGAQLLIADPLERTRTAMRDLASLWGMTVRTAATGREALALLNEAADRGSPFDLALIDAQLRDPEPAELAQRIRNAPALAATRLVLAAPAGLRGDARRAEAAGFAAYLEKPLAAETLMACLRALRGGPPSAIVTRHSLVERGGPALRILVVDDNPLNCRLLGLLLERAGHRVASVQSGEAALARLAAEPFDLVLMDMQMPGLDGLETTRRIRALPDLGKARVPVVAVTANAMPGDEQRCRAAGMDGCLTKPIDGASLAAAVERHARPERLSQSESILDFAQP
ncbi:MAG: response regulator [Geminicoccaceae bacterium]|nr:response regulator [Geminicoccaceae bacterium]